MKKQSIYATAKLARTWEDNRTLKKHEIRPAFEASESLSLYMCQNFLRLLRALKRTVRLHSTPQAPCVCSRQRDDMRKLIKKMEEMT